MLYDGQWYAGTQRKLKMIVEAKELILFQSDVICITEIVFNVLKNKETIIIPYGSAINFKANGICKIRKRDFEKTFNLI
jgi:hypothetical protein